MSDVPLFESFMVGGFECSTHRIRSGRRLDLIAATGHDRHVRADYQRLRTAGIHTAREGMCWHPIEPSPWRYTFASLLPIVHAVEQIGIQVIWDLCHCGWPKDIDLFDGAFVERVAAYARAVTRLLQAESGRTPVIAPVNEISFFAWAAGQVGYFHPFATERGDAVKRQLIRATIAAIEAIWEVAPTARFIHLDPVISPVAALNRPEDRAGADAEWRRQFQAWDMLSGREAPELGGRPEYLDVIGVNYYPHNQWIYNAASWESRVPIALGHPQYRRLHELIADVYARYGRPMMTAETGNEDDRRAGWLRYLGREARAARRAGVPLEGLCWYPILNHPGWNDDRHCHNGLWDYADERGAREAYLPLSHEVERQNRLFRRARLGNPAVAR